MFEPFSFLSRSSFFIDPSTLSRSAALCCPPALLTMSMSIVIVMAQFLWALFVCSSWMLFSFLARADAEWYIKINLQWPKKKEIFNHIPWRDIQNPCLMLTHHTHTHNMYKFDVCWFGHRFNYYCIRMFGSVFFFSEGALDSKLSRWFRKTKD